MPAGTSHGYCLLCVPPLLGSCYVIGYEQPKTWIPVVVGRHGETYGNELLRESQLKRKHLRTKGVTCIMTCVHLAHPRVSKRFELVFPPALAGRLVHRPLPESRSSPRGWNRRPRRGACLVLFSRPRRFRRPSTDGSNRRKARCIVINERFSIVRYSTRAIAANSARAILGRRHR